MSVYRRLVDILLPLLAFDDFGAVQYNISVQPNTELILNLTFPIFDDNMAEHCEEVFMVQTSGVGGAHVTGNSSAEVIIKDNDSKRPIVSSLLEQCNLHIIYGNQ